MLQLAKQQGFARLEIAVMKKTNRQIRCKGKGHSYSMLIVPNQTGPEGKIGFLWSDGKGSFLSFLNSEYATREKIKTLSFPYVYKDMKALPWMAMTMGVKEVLFFNEDRGCWQLVR